MEIKKNPSVNLEQMRPRFFITGLAIACACVLVAFEWTTFADVETEPPGEIVDFMPEEIDAIITYREQPKPEQQVEQPRKASQDFSQSTDIQISDDPSDATDDLPELPELTEIPETGDTIWEPQIELVHDWVQEMPLFGNSDNEEESYIEIQKFLGKNVRYPIYARENHIQGPVWVEFVVSKNGAVSDIKVIRELEGGCSEEAARVITKMPDWKPGKQMGKPVSVRYRQKINFKLAN